jgi:hypothetical protein
VLLGMSQSQAMDMAAQRVPMKKFLGAAKGALRSAIDQAKPVTFVVGNESAGKNRTAFVFHHPLVVLEL